MLKIILFVTALSTVEIKKKCKELGIKSTGKKRSEMISALLSIPTVRYADYSVVDLEEICISRNIPVSSLSPDIPISRETLLERLGNDETAASSILKNAELKMPSKKLKFKIRTIEMTPIEFSPGGTPAVDSAVLKILAGNNLFGDEKDAQWGHLYGHFGGGKRGAAACRAVGALAQMSQINTTIRSFLIPLQELADKSSRIHCSLNLNTDTGRLSARTPNLQNQPALEKDQYKIRDAFCAEKDNTLIVADYGQLELRLLAHMTDCKVVISYYLLFGNVKIIFTVCFCTEHDRRI